MTDPQKNPVQFVRDIESVRLANWFFRVTWKTTAGLVAITTRLFAAIVLAMARRRQRNRFLR